MSVPPELLQAVAAFVPAYIVRDIVAGRVLKPGEVILSEGAAIFADLAGFTPMTERLARLMLSHAPEAEARGAEELTRLINQIFSAMLAPIQESGGVISRFSGDALTAYFERPPQLSSSEVVAAALSCAHAMQQAAAPFKQVPIEDEVFSVSVKIGLGYGSALSLVVGDPAGAMECVLLGPALAGAAAAEGCARRGEVVLAPGAWQRLPAGSPVSDRRAECDAVTPSLGAYRLAPPPQGRDRRLPGADTSLDGLDPAARERVLHALAPFLPRSIYERLLLAQGELPGDYRRVTNLFVSFSGLDAASAVDDPEKLQAEAAGIGEKLQAYYRWAHAVVEQHEGRLLRVLADDKGTELHILFGAPEKQADDPTRGLRCALALRRAPGRPAFVTEQRIGVASGTVFAATIGSPRRREYTVIGDEINLSARLTAACPPGEVLVDAYTRDRTARQFEFETLPPMQLKGKSGPVLAHRLLGERPQETGLVVRYLASRWRIVGRDAELSAVRQAADQAMAGAGRVIAIEGHAGVGKTRLLEEVVRHWVAGGGDGFAGQAVSHGANSPYHLWASFWHAFFGFAEADSAEQRWHKLAGALAEEAPELIPWAGVLAAVSGLSAEEAPLPSGLDAAGRRRRLFEMTVTLLAARARRRPLLVLFEDLHWADRPSLELVDYVGARIAQFPLLLCLSFRPREDLDLEVLTAMETTWRILDELQPDESAELVRAILGEVHLPPALEQEIFDRTQGNPLFVEELLGSFISGGALLPHNGGYRWAGDPGRMRIPDTLQDLLMARIDRLEAPSRELVQVASVIDRRFPYAILRGVYPYAMSELEMRDRLDELVRPEDLTRLERPEPDLVYLFKHALTRDVAYASLPFARRKQLHRRAGEFIETLYADRLEEYYGTLAHHFRQSREWERALAHALHAGMQAQEVYANQEAMRYYQQVEEYLGYLGGEAEGESALRMYLQRSTLHRLNGDYPLAEADLMRALDLAGRHGDSRAEAEGYCLLADLRYYEMRNEESLAAAHRAYGHASAGGHTTELNTALVQLGIAYQMLGDIERSMQYLEQAHDLAEARGDRLMLARALNTMGVAWWLYRGELDKALAGFRRVLEIRREAGAKDREAECLANLANVLFRRGDFEAALETSEAALRVGRAAGWQYGISYVQLDQADVHCYLGEYARGQELIEEAERNLAEGDELGRAYLQLWQGRNIYCDLGRHELALPVLQESLQFMRSYDHYEEMIRALTALGACRTRLGDLPGARACLVEAHELSLAQQFPWQRSEIRYRLGLVALAEGRPDEAEAWAGSAQGAVSQGSAPDWQGPVQLLLARIARRSGAAAGPVASLYERSVELAEVRCRAVERAWVWREAGAYLAAYSDGEACGRGQDVLARAETWLAERGVPVLPGS